MCSSDLPTTGVTIPAGRTMMIAWNGSDFVDVSTSFAAAGSANGVVYLDASKVPTAGTTLTFDGTNFNVLSTGFLRIDNNGGSSGKGRLNIGNSGYAYVEGWDVGNAGSGAYLSFGLNTEQMRLTSTGLGIGTSSPGNKLDINGSTRIRAGNALYFQNAAADANGTIVASGGAGDNSLSFNSGALLLNASGNLGLGVTPSAWSASYKALLVGATASLWSGASGELASVQSNAYFNGTNYIRQIAGYATG